MVNTNLIMNISTILDGYPLQDIFLEPLQWRSLQIFKGLSI